MMQPPVETPIALVSNREIGPRAVYLMKIQAFKKCPFIENDAKI